MLSCGDDNPCGQPWRDVNAVDYLLQPFDETRFDAVMKRVRERLTGGITQSAVNGG